jgi:ADP-ribose diphosphatase
LALVNFHPGVFRPISTQHSQDHSMMSWRTISRNTILDHSKWLRVEDHSIELPDGRQLSDWPWVITPDYVNVVATDELGRFLCFRQTKYAVEGVSLAPAGGYVEAGEAPLTTAQRELREEMGYSSTEWHGLGSYSIDGNHGVGTAHLFLALQARRVGETVADDLEEQEFLRLTRAEVEEALESGQFKVLSWATAFALALISIDNLRQKR